MKHVVYTAFILYSLLLSACDSDIVADQNVIIVDKSWPYLAMPKVQVHILDKVSKYNVYLNLRHDGEYKYANIFVRIHETSPKDVHKTLRKELKLAELDGRWTGRSAGNLYAHQVLIHENYSFPDTGIYTFTIEQNMRENPLQNINDVGIKVLRR